jgi:molybdenum cofactor cytidylyltransferase
MKFGMVRIDDAAGCVLAHSTGQGKVAFKKGRVLGLADIDILRNAGIGEVMAARMEAGDIAEDAAAHQIAVAACGTGARTQAAFTGRANLYAAAHGLVVVDEVRLRALNHIHESLTIATLANFRVVDVKQMVATIKVIPFAVPGWVLEKALAVTGNTPLLLVEPFQHKSVGLVITTLAKTKASLIAKSENSMRQRVADLGSSISEVIVCAHEALLVGAAISQLRARGCDVILVFGASAIVDREDVIPLALTKVQGEVLQLGMPVDPGNLMMLGRLNGVPVIGVPSCARSPKENGFDWVLQRVLAGLDVSADDVMDMGAGGLLNEISSRPAPREHKMLADVQGQKLIVATVSQILKSSVEEVVVVTGHGGDAVAAALAGLRVRIVHNEDFALGLSSSLRAGLNAVSSMADAVVICLGDMPLVGPDVVDRLIAGFSPADNRTVVVPTCEGQMGNPVLWGRDHFMALMGLEGDRGARGLIERNKDSVVEVDVGTRAVLIDADTPGDLSALADELESSRRKAIAPSQ